MLLQVLERLLDPLDILEAELLADDVEVADGVHVALDVDDLRVVEAPHDLEDGVDSADVRQEGVAQTCTGRGAARQTGDVVHGQGGGHLRLGLVVFAEPVEACIGDDDTGFLGLDGGIGEVGGVTKVGLGDGLEERRLADVCKTDLEKRQSACAIEANRGEKKAKEGRGRAASLTYDTALQVISRATEKDLLLDGDLLGRHLLFLLAAGVGATDEKGGEERGSALLAAVFEGRGNGRTSCGGSKAEGEGEEKERGGLEGRRGDGGHTGGQG